MQHLEGVLRESLASIANAREIGLRKAQLVKGYLDDAIPAQSRSATQGNASAALVERIANDLISLAEERFLAQIRKMAMDLMEHDRSLTAAEASAYVEGMILDAVLD